MANYDAQINILVSGQRNINNLLNQLNQVEGAIGQIESRWRVAAAALQRADVRLGAALKRPRDERGRFTSTPDPDRQARMNAAANRRAAVQDLARARGSLRIEAQRAALVREQIDGNQRILRQSEARITFEQRLNSAVELFQTRQQKFARGGGGRALSQELQDKARSIQAAYEAAGGSGARNLRLVNALATGLGRVVERQNEFNRLQALSSKGFEAGRRLQERITAASSVGGLSRQRVTAARSLATETISASRSGNQQAYEEALRRATAATARLERESNELARAINDQEREIARIARIGPRSPVRGGVNFPGSPKAEEEAAKQREKALRANEKLSSAAVALEKQRQSALEKIFQVEEKIRSSKKISLKEAQDYYFQAQLPRTALPFGDPNQPAMRGGARRGGVSREVLGGARTADEAEATFRLIEEKSKKAAKAVKQSFADAYSSALPSDALSGLTALEKVGKALASMKGGGVAAQQNQRKELASLQEALSAMEGKKYNPFGISDKQVNAGLNERAAQLEKILQIEEKIRSSRKISAKDAQDYYSATRLRRLALPFGDVNQPAIRGGARQGGSAIEFLGGGRSAEEAQTTFKLIEDTGRKTGKAIKEGFVDAYKAMLPPDAILTGLEALGKAGKELASMKVLGGGQSGLEKALGSLQEARGARERFFGGASPAEAIDQIVREFNTGKPAASEAAGNITQTFSSGLKKGAAGAASAAKSFATAATQAINKAFGIKSPSRFMIELVQNLTNTFIAEMLKSYPRIEAATQKAFGQQTLLRDVNKLTATSEGFEFTGRPSTGFRPLAMGAGTEGVSSEFQEMMNTFRKQIAGLTIQPEIYQNLLKALPDSRITTDLAGAANRRALVSEELPSFLPTQRMLGPGELEKTIASAAADYFRTVRTPDPWVGLVGDYKRNFVDKITALNQKGWGLSDLFSRISGAVGAASATVKAQLALPPAREARIAGALPPSLFDSGLSPTKELRRLRAYQHSEERRAAVMGGGATRGLSLPSGGSQLALPPAASRSLQDAVSDLFNRISDTVRQIPTAIGGAFGGGGSRGPGAGAPGGAPPLPPGGPEQMARTLLGLDALGDISRISTRELETLSALFAELRSVIDPTVQGFDRLDNQLRETIGNIGRQAERRAPDADFLTRRFGPRAGRGISEGLIGGAFPLLFGQGAGAALGGLAGGAAGGFAGGGLGFGLSLIGTALGTAFDQLGQAAQETGKSLSYPIEGFEKLKEAGLLASRQQEYYISKLIESGRTAEATAQIQAEMIKKIGVSGVNDLTELGDTSSRLSRTWAEFNLQLQAALAGPMSGLLDWVTSVLNLANQSSRSQQLVKDVSAGLSGKEKQIFDREIQKINLSEQIGTTWGPLFGGLNAMQAAKRRTALAEFYAPSAKPIEIKRGKLTPEQEQAGLDEAIEKADKARALAQQGIALERSDMEHRLSIEDTVYGLRKRAIDMEREAVEFRRSMEDQIFSKRQELEQKLIENNRKRQQNVIDAFDLQLQKASVNLDPIAQGVVDAARDYLRIRTEGEADLQQTEKQVKLELQRMDQEASHYKLQVEDRVSQMAVQRDEFSRDVTRARLQIENQIADRAVQVEEYKLLMAKHRYEVEIDLEKKKQIVAQEGLGVVATGKNYANVGGFQGGRQMLHGIPGYAGYDPSHGSETNIHYHFAGKNPAETKAVADYLKGLGYKITEFGQYGQGVGRHSAGSQHYREQGFNAFDIPGSSMGGPMSQIIEGQKRVHNLIGDFLALTPAARASVVGGSAASAAAQTASGAVGAAPVLQPAVAMPTLPAAPQLIGVNDLLQQYLQNVAKIKTATVDATEIDKEALAVRIQAARVALEQQTLAPILQYREQNRELEFEIEKRKERNRLLTEGYKPEIVEGELRVLEIQRALKSVLAGLEATTNGLVKEELARLNLNPKLIDATFRLTEATLTDLLLTTDDIEKKEELRAKLQAILDLKNQLAGSAEGEAGSAIQGTRDIASMEAQPGQKLATFIAESTASLKDLEQVAINVSQGIGNAVGSSLANGVIGLIEGTTTAKEVFAGFLRDVGQILVQEGTKMIAMYIAIAIAKAIAGLSNSGGSGDYSGAFKSTPGTSFGDALKMPKLAANGATFANGIATFANGGAFTNSVVSSPTLFKFANGGTTQTGLMGEAGPEAIMPLSRGSGGRLGVDATGLREAMSGGNSGAGGGAPTLNMSFETSTINGVEYVSREQLEQAMAETRRNASRDGAQRGMTMTLDRIQNSSSTRRRIGV